MARPSKLNDCVTTLVNSSARSVSLTPCSVLNLSNSAAGDAFAVDYGSGYDIALLTNFLHHFDEATCVSLLQKVGRALKQRRIPGSTMLPRTKTRVARM